MQSSCVPGALLTDLPSAFLACAGRLGYLSILAFQQTTSPLPSVKHDRTESEHMGTLSRATTLTVLSQRRCG